MSPARTVDSNDTEVYIKVISDLGFSVPGLILKGLATWSHEASSAIGSEKVH
jgi:hypothetical protein